MTMNSAEVFEQLQEAWLVLTPNGSSPPLESPFHAEGLAAPIYTRWELAQMAVERYPEGAEVAVQPAPPLLQCVRLLAEQGFAGLLVDEQVPLFLVTTEPDSELPTHVALPQEEELLIVGDEGVSDLRRADVTRWTNFAAFDRQAIRWMLGEAQPFAGYQEDMMLLEYLPDNEPQPLEEKGMLLEREEEVDRSIAFFSTAFAAEWYWETHEEARLTGEGEQAEQLVAHADVVEVLESRSRAFPRSALILNPGRHRFYQGFFRKVDEAWFLVTINGVWLITPPFRCTKVARRS